jgi:hypothetical protein
MRARLIAIAILSGLLCLGTVGSVAAANGNGNGKRTDSGKAVELVRPRGLLLMGPINQSVGLRYEYYGRDAENYESSTHRFREKYSLNTIAAILDPDLLMLNLTVDFWLEQQEDNYENAGSESADTTRMSYDFSAAAFERSYHPVVFRSSIEETEVSNTYSPTYSLTTSRNSLTAKLFTDPANYRFHYQHMTYDSSGRERDSSRTTDLGLFTVVSDYRDISHTQFDFTWEQQEQDIEQSGTFDSDSTIFTLTNSLRLDSARKYVLASTVSRQDGTVAGDPQESLDITESLHAQFGRALIGEATYDYEYDKLPVGDDQQELTANSLELNLNHMLYQSLQTRLEWYIRDSEVAGGEELRTRTGLWFQYLKKLPMASMLTINTGGSHEETNRDFDEPLVIAFPPQNFTSSDVRDEGDTLSLTLQLNGGTLDSVLRVVGQEGELFTIDTDYFVNFDRGTVEFYEFSDLYSYLESGKRVQVTYLVSTAENDYTTDIYSVSGSLSLFEGRQRISASYYHEDQTLESGVVAGNSLPDLTEIEVRYDLHLDYHRFGLEYGSYESGDNYYWYLEGEWYYDRRFPRSTVRLQARDRYTFYEAPNSNSSDYDVNTLTLGGTYTRRLLTWASLMVSLNYAHVSGDYVDRDLVYFKTTLQGKINQLILSLNGTTTFRFEEDETIRDDFLSVEVTRLF